MRILFFFIFLELAVFAGVAHFIGIFNALMLAISFSILGGIILSRSGAQRLMGAGPNKEAVMMAAMMSGQKIDLPKIMAGLLLVLPGFITDLLGLLCLIPSVRSKMMGMAMQKAMSGGFGKPAGFGQTKKSKPKKSSSNIIEGEYIEKAKND